MCICLFPRSKNVYSGSMSIYFPCKLKSGYPISMLNDRFRRWQQHQINIIHSTSAPLTDLMDKQQNRKINETSLNIFQKAIARGSVINENCAPFGTECLRLAYQKNREDNLFAKNAQLLLSRFSFKYTIKNKNKVLDCDGVILYNVNADNSVATFIVTLNFEKYHAIDLVYLKHIFYKRLLIDIEEYDIVTKKCDCIAGNCDCLKGDWFGCLNKNVSKKSLGKMTIQDFVNEKKKQILLQRQIEYDIDYRARYSFIELKKPVQQLETNCEKHLKLKTYKQDINECYLRELYGIMMSDEGYEYYPVLRHFRCNLSIFLCIFPFLILL